MDTYWMYWMNISLYGIIENVHSSFLFSIQKHIDFIFNSKLLIIWHTKYAFYIDLIFFLSCMCSSVGKWNWNEEPIDQYNTIHM